MSSQADKLVETYLKRLESELRDLTKQRRGELVDEIAEHIAEARADLETQDEAAIRTLLERIGAPEEIAAEANGRVEARPAGAGWKEVGALVLLPIGGVLLPVFGWLIGVVLLWLSDAWRTREKLLGTLLFPGGLLIPVALGVLASESSSCGTVVTPQLSPQPISDACTGPDGTAWWEVALVVVLIAVPIGMVVYLARRMRRMAPATPA
jgi:hypothetical protein